MFLTTNPLLAQNAEPHPWLADAPGEFVRLIDRGNVSIVVDDERIRKAGKTALTIFQFSVDYDFKYRQQLLGFDSKTNTWQAKMIAWMDQPKLKLEHKICIQSTFNPSLPWESRLLRHEFDHVAISSDPRILKIMKRMLQQRQQWTATFEQVNRPTEKDFRKCILERITTQVRTIEMLVQSQYDYLDQESAQGVTNIVDRKEFFTRLYTMEGVDRCKIELGDSTRDYVKQLLSSEANQKEIDGHYLFLVQAK